jgi:hypothetical protein
MLLFAAGCGSKASLTENNQQNADTAAAGAIDSTKQPAAPENAPDMTGKVKTIEGNKLTVYKVNVANNRRPPENPPEGTTPPDETTKPQQQRQNSDKGGTPAPNDEMFEVTDETISLVISEDASIVKGFGRNTNNNETTQLSIEDIKTGDILGLRFGEKSSDGEQSVNSVRIMQSNR